MILCTYFNVAFLTSYIMVVQTWEVVCVKVKLFSDIPFFITVNVEHIVREHKQ